MSRMAQLVPDREGFEGAPLRPWSTRACALPPLRCDRALLKKAESRALTLILDDRIGRQALAVAAGVRRRQLRDARVLVIGTYRDAEARQPPLAEALAALARLAGACRSAAR
jgi:hypothetical protein